MSEISKCAPGGDTGSIGNIVEEAVEEFHARTAKDCKSYEDITCCPGDRFIASETGFIEHRDFELVPGITVTRISSGTLLGNIAEVREDMWEDCTERNEVLGLFDGASETTCLDLSTAIACYKPTSHEKLFSFFINTIREAALMTEDEEVIQRTKVVIWVLQALAAPQTLSFKEYL